MCPRLMKTYTVSFSAAKALVHTVEKMWGTKVVD